jgi:hypothetical protein
MTGLITNIFFLILLFIPKKKCKKVSHTLPSSPCCFSASGCGAGISHSSVGGTTHLDESLSKTSCAGQRCNLG